jgi:hypothetical protein
MNTTLNREKINLFTDEQKDFIKQIKKELRAIRRLFKEGEEANLGYSIRNCPKDPIKLLNQVLENCTSVEDVLTAIINLNLSLVSVRVIFERGDERQIAIAIKQLRDEIVKMCDDRITQENTEFKTMFDRLKPNFEQILNPEDTLESFDGLFPNTENNATLAQCRVWLQDIIEYSKNFSINVDQKNYVSCYRAIQKITTNLRKINNALRSNSNTQQKEFLDALDKEVHKLKPLFKYLENTLPSILSDL